MQDERDNRDGLTSTAAAEGITVLPGVQSQTQTPSAAREKAEEPAESTEAALEKGSPTGKVRWAREALGQRGAGDTKRRAEQKQRLSKAQLIKGVRTLYLGLGLGPSDTDLNIVPCG